MPDHLGDDMRRVKAEEKEEKEIKGKHWRLAPPKYGSHLNFFPKSFQLWMKAILNC